MQSKVLGALLGAGLALSAAPTLAANVTLTGWAYGHGNNVQASVASSSLGSYAGAAGGFVGQLSGAGALDSSRFITYCIELEESFHFGANPMTGYTVQSAASYFNARAALNASRPGGQSVAGRLGQLITWVNADPTRVDTAAESTALQLAIWNIVYDSDWTVTAVSAFRDTSASRTLATQMLQGAADTQGRYEVFALQRAGSQDFIAALRVPEPGSAALVLAGLMAAAAAGQRLRRRASMAISASTPSTTNSARL